MVKPWAVITATPWPCAQHPAARPPAAGRVGQGRALHSRTALLLSHSSRQCPPDLRPSHLCFRHLDELVGNHRLAVLEIQHWVLELVIGIVACGVVRWVHTREPHRAPHPSDPPKPHTASCWSSGYTDTEGAGFRWPVPRWPMELVFAAPDRDLQLLTTTARISIRFDSRADRTAKHRLTRAPMEGPFSDELERNWRRVASTHTLQARRACCRPVSACWLPPLPLVPTPFAGGCRHVSLLTAHFAARASLNCRICWMLTSQHGLMSRPTGGCSCWGVAHALFPAPQAVLPSHCAVTLVPAAARQVPVPRNFLCARPSCRVLLIVSGVASFALCVFCMLVGSAAVAAHCLPPSLLSRLKYGSQPHVPP